MERYTIYCTPEQTKKALELGAPISRHAISYKYLEPTAEQLIGWLEEQGILVDINPINGLHFYYIIRTKEFDEGCDAFLWEAQYRTPEVEREYNSRKEAILAAIDVALEYLIHLKNDE